MWQEIIKTFYLLLPAYFANMAPVFFANLGGLKFLAKPIDANRMLFGQPIFGKNKTWRGILVGVLVAIVIAWIQFVLAGFDFFRHLSFFDYSNFLLFGFLAGLGAMLGDLLKSFFKRRFKITSGNPWPIFDQLDFVFGFFLLTYFLVRPPVGAIVSAILITLILHPLTNLAGYYLKLKKVWW